MLELLLLCSLACTVLFSVLTVSLSGSSFNRELLRGPLIYVLTLLLSAVVFWCESPIGVISLSMMCGGNGSVCLFPTLFSPMPLDYFSLVQPLIGVANIIGRRFGSMKIFYNKKKIWAGSISMFVFGFLISIGCVQLYGF